MRKLNCKKIEDLLPLFLEGELSEREAKEVEEHISACKKCASSLKEWERCLSLLRGVPRLEAPDYLWQRIKMRLPVGEKQKAKPRLRWIYAFGFSLIVIICSALFFHTLTSHRSAQQVSVSSPAPAPLPQAETPLGSPAAPPFVKKPAPQIVKRPTIIAKPKVYASAPRSTAVVARGNIKKGVHPSNGASIEDKVLERLQMALLSANSAESSLERTLNALQEGNSEGR